MNIYLTDNSYFSLFLLFLLMNFDLFYQITAMELDVKFRYNDRQKYFFPNRLMSRYILSHPQGYKFRWRKEAHFVQNRRKSIKSRRTNIFLLIKATTDLNIHKYSFKVIPCGTQVPPWASILNKMAPFQNSTWSSQFYHFEYQKPIAIKIRQFHTFHMVLNSFSYMLEKAPR